MENQQIKNQQNPQGANQQDSENGLNLRDIIFLVLNNWYWFVISLFVCLVLSAVIYKTKPKTYGQAARIMVRDEQSKGGYQARNMDAIFNSMGMDNGMHSLENEIYLLQSSSLMKNVVTRLNLNNTCSRNSLFKKISYYKDKPLEMKVFSEIDERPEVSIAVEVTPRDGNRYDYRVVRLEAEKCNVKGTAYYAEPVSVGSSVSFTVDKTARFSNNLVGVTFDMASCPAQSKAYQMLRKLSVTRVDKMASILSITYEDDNEARANEVVNTLVDVYNEDGINDKNKVAEKTEQFVSDRIALISGELDDVDAKVEQLKNQEKGKQDGEKQEGNEDSQKSAEEAKEEFNKMMDELDDLLEKNKDIQQPFDVEKDEAMQESIEQDLNDAFTRTKSSSAA